MDLIKLKQQQKLLHSKGYHKHNERTTHRMGDNICKWCEQLGINSKIYKQLMQLSIQKKKKKKSKQKHAQKIWIDISPNKTFRWSRDTWKDYQHVNH